jgi:hypothetical protein
MLRRCLRRKDISIKDETAEEMQNECRNETEDDKGNRREEKHKETKIQKQRPKTNKEDIITKSKK